jgi:hypothetical protein
MGLINKLEAVGRKVVGLDGGLNTRLDPTSLQPPQTTTADNVWHATNGAIRQLPGPSGSILPTSKNLYNIVNTNGVQPLGAGGVLTIQESVTGPSLTAGFGAVNANNPAPLHQFSLRTRNIGNTTSVNTTSPGPAVQYTTPTGLPADAPFRPYAIMYTTASGGVSSSLVGDMVSQAQQIGGFVTSTADFVIGSFPGNTSLWFELSTTATTLRMNTFRFIGSTGTPGSLTISTGSSGNYTHMATAPLGSNRALIAYMKGTSLCVAAVTPTAVSYSDITWATGLTAGSTVSVSVVGGSSGAALVTVNNGTNVTLYCQPIANLGTTSNITSLVLATDVGGTVSSVTVTGTYNPTANILTGAAFFAIKETFSGFGGFNTDVSQYGIATAPWAFTSTQCITFSAVFGGANYALALAPIGAGLQALRNPQGVFPIGAAFPQLQLTRRPGRS